ncbi:sensor histidine kinase [Amycolatopsis circi]|uniref:sensor histidine kinase n=1 Tax=Amycolatopsis circi TaxID=871959 RepID=UPI000E247660|nr:sensor histidine kinase [Amycolatopsis circi]
MNGLDRGRRLSEFVRSLRRRLLSKPMVLDSALAAVVLMTVVVLVGIRPWSGTYPHVPTWWYLIAAMTAIPLVWRRRFPFGVGLVVGAAALAAALVPNVPEQRMPYGVLVAAYTIADRGKRWQRLLVLLLGPVAVVTSAGSVRDAVLSYQFPLLVVIGAYLLGSTARIRRAYVESLEDRARSLERERDLETFRAAARERQRIARDMHDILAHSVAVMTVQAEAGPVALESEPGKARAAFDAIADAGRTAQVELKRLLGVLRDTDGETPLLPQPGLHDVEQLVAQVGGAGLEVSYRTTGSPREVSPGIGIAAYRIVQEALTNVLKHAVAEHAEVTVSWSADRLTLRIADDGWGTRGAVSGHGLVGIRERVASCGGSIEAGSQGRGFVVSAELPFALAGEQETV